MYVKDHLLFAEGGAQVPFVATPNQSSGIKQRYLVIHFTAGRSDESSIAWFKNGDAKASAHLVIGRDGTVTQMVPFNKKAWHAGESKWNGLTGLNAYSIGIELDNAGNLQRKGGRWTAWFGAVIPDDQVFVATHKNEKTESGWHIYPEAQITAALDVAAALHKAYNFEDILGHEDIAPGRKTDPGPAFPMASFKSRIFGRAGG